MKQSLLNNAAVALCAILGIQPMLAKQGAPHTVSATSNYQSVTLKWCDPNAAKQLKWHDGSDYNGDYAAAKDSQSVTKCYAGARFDANDLKNYVGETVTGIAYSMYRTLVGARVLVYENGKVVASGDADMSKYVKNAMLTVDLSTPVTIKANSEYLFAVEYTYGSNMDFIAIKDRATDAPGKGDLFSTDGVNWSATGAGDYLVTAVLANDVDEAPVSYDVYRGSEKLNDSPLTATSLTVADQPVGTNEYTVRAAYDGAEYASSSVSANVNKFSSTLPSPNISGAEVNGLNVDLSWTAPLNGAEALTWGNETLSQNIGGTATSNTKVWIRNQFSSSDLWAYENATIDSISTKFAEKDVVTGITVWVQKDGAFVYNEAVAADVISAIQANEWVNFPLSTPVAIEPGHTYSYGLYVLHAAKAHPISVSNAETVDVKGNSFSVSSASSTFTKSSPSWKTLKSGGIYGNWMMKANVSSHKTYSDVTYDVYRDGVKVASGLTDTKYTDTVDDLGTYTYGVRAVSADMASLDAETDATVSLPAGYEAPLLTESSYDADTNKVNLTWSHDVALAKCGDAAYYISFDEDMAMMWGAQFTAADLEPYKGKQITKIKFGIGESFGDLKVGVYSKTGTALSELSFTKDEIEPLTLYTVSLPTPVDIDGTQDLYLAYSGTIPAGKNAILIDAGSLKDGGAMVSLTNGASWMKLGTINSTYSKYNIIISAIAGDAADNSGDAAAPMQQSAIKAMPTASVSRELGVDAIGSVAMRAPARQASIASYNVYHNGIKVANTTQRSYSEDVTRHASHSYYVTTVFSNGWESPASAALEFTNSIEQKAKAPYGLTGELTNSQLTLNWQSPDNAKVLSYMTDASQALGLGMTGTNPTSYVGAKYLIADQADLLGKRIDHIQFYLYTNDVTTLSVYVAVNENIVYTQSVPVSTLVTGLNDVRLNEPFEITATGDITYGYVTKYATGVKPLAMENGPAKAGYGDIISASAGNGYWYSLYTKFKQDHNWYLSAVLSEPDNAAVAKAPARAEESATTYNVYRDGTLVASAVSATTYTEANPVNGKYYVTAVDATGNESGESNAVVVSTMSGIADLTADRTDATVIYYNLQGIAIDKDNLTSGIYLRRQGQSVAKVIVK
jgi:hypothetical protein